MRFIINPLVHIIGIILLSCNTHKLDNDQTPIARVGSATLTKTELKKRLPLNYSEENKFAAVNQWINTELIYLAGKKHGFEKTREIQTSLKKYRRTLIGNLFLESVTHSAGEISKDDVSTHYNNNKESFRRNLDEAKVVHAFYKTKKAALNGKKILMRRLSASNTTASLDTTTEVITLKRGESVEPIDRVVFNPANGSGLYGPIESTNGFHVLQILNKYKTGSMRNLDQVYEEIVRRLSHRQRTIAALSVLDSLRRDYSIETYLEYNQ